MCNCILEVNKMLFEKETGAAVLVNLFGPPKATIGLYATKKVRGRRLPVMMATFCPFCGEKYPDPCAATVERRDA